MPVIGDFFRRETLGGANKLFVLQDMKRGPISLGSFLLAPPFVELAQGIQQFPCSGFQVTIPMSPVLVGVEVHMQGFLQDIGPVSPRAKEGPTWFGRAEERWRKRFERDE